MENPTAEYDALSRAFSFFNKALFDDRLPPVLLTLSKHGRSLGYYRNRAFVSRVQQGTVADEIALCANTFSGRSDNAVLSTLAHEMAHLWQHTFGKKVSRSGYHNLEWADRMLAIGLHPSDTGKPGGKKYGHRMTHYVIEGGRFDLVANHFLSNGWRLQWENASNVPVSDSAEWEHPEKPKQTRKRFVCGQCQMLAMAKFTARLNCGFCGTAMT